MQSMLIVLYLGRMRIVFCINDQHFATITQGNIALHYGEHSPNSIVERPWNLGCANTKSRILFSEVLEDKLLVQSAHQLFINKRSNFVFALVRCKKHAFQNELTKADEHTVTLIATLKADGRPFY